MCREKHRVVLGQWAMISVETATDVFLARPQVAYTSVATNILSRYYLQHCTLGKQVVGLKQALLPLSLGAVLLSRPPNLALPERNEFG